MEHRVKDLPVDARHWVEQLLGRPVGENETISVRSIPVIKEAPPFEKRLEIAKEMDEYFKRIDKKLQGVDERELQEAVEEAIREVRKSHQPAK